MYTNQCEQIELCMLDRWACTCDWLIKSCTDSKQTNKKNNLLWPGQGKIPKSCYFSPMIQSGKKSFKGRGENPGILSSSPADAVILGH